MLCGFSLYAFVFSSGGHAAPDVALCPVLIQQRADFQVQRSAQLRQSGGKVLVYSGFRDTEFLGSGPNGSPVLDHVYSQLTGSLFHVSLQEGTSHSFYETMYAGKRLRMQCTNMSDELK